MSLSTFQLKIFVFLIVFSPAITLGARYIYLFEIITLIYLCLSLLINKLLKKDFYIFFVFLIFVFIILLMQSFLYDQLMALELLRMSLALAILFVIKISDKYIDFEVIINFAMKVALFAAVIGIIQTIDGLIFSNAIGVNKVLSVLYPYAGELVGSASAKSGGLQLKMSSGSSSTSTFDGHPILFSDFLVLASILFIYYKRYLGLGIILLSLICTFTRGAWIAVILTIIFHIFFQTKNTTKKDYVIYFVIVFVIGCFIYSIEPLRNYFEFRLLNTLATFDLIDGYHLGRSDDPRTEKVWPAFFNLLSTNGITAYLWGVPTSLPTDSGYLSIIQNEGLLGLILLIILFSYIYTFQILHKGPALLMFVSLSIVFIVHPVFQGYKSTYFFVFLLLIFQIKKNKLGIKYNVYQ